MITICGLALSKNIQPVRILSWLDRNEMSVNAHINETVFFLIQPIFDWEDIDGNDAVSNTLITDFS